MAGKESHTNSFSCTSGSKYEITIQPELWYAAGNLNIPATGTFEQDTTVYASTAPRARDYWITVYLANSGGRLGAKLTWVSGANEDSDYGDIQPRKIIDVAQPQSRTRFRWSFWGLGNIRDYVAYITFKIYEDDGKTLLFDSGKLQSPSSTMSFYVTDNSGKVYDYYANNVGKTSKVWMHIDF